MVDRLVGSIATQITYCQKHYDELMLALVKRNLSEFLSATSLELVDKLEEGQMDAGLEASSAITGSALQLFGPEAILACKGCPVCAFQNIITHVADHTAVKYTRSN